MRFVGVVLALGLVQAAYAQPPEVPQEVRDIIDELAQDYGMTPYGEVILSELDDGASEKLVVQVAPDKLTYVDVEGNDDTLEMLLSATAGGKEFLPELGTTIQIPPGNGDKVTLEVAMSCEFISCAYFVQAFVR